MDSRKSSVKSYSPIRRTKSPNDGLVFSKKMTNRDRIEKTAENNFRYFACESRKWRAFSIFPEVDCRQKAGRRGITKQIQWQGCFQVFASVCARIVEPAPRGTCLSRLANWNRASYLAASPESLIERINSTETSQRGERERETRPGITIQACKFARYRAMSRNPRGTRDAKGADFERNTIWRF